LEAVCPDIAVDYILLTPEIKGRQQALGANKHWAPTSTSQRQRYFDSKEIATNHLEVEVVVEWAAQHKSYED
jgi:hypothetical protein